MSSPAPSARSTRRDERSLRHRVNRLMIAGLSLQLVLVVLTIGAALLAAVDGLRAVADRGTEIAAATLLAGMADQQSGLLAYVNSPADAELLLVYTQGQQETDRSLHDLRVGTTGTARAAQAAHVESDVRAWERWAEGARLQVAATKSPLVDPTAVESGRQLFAVFRADQHDLEAALEHDSADGTQAALVTTLVKVAIVVVGSVATAALLQLTARRVARHGLGPLGELSRAASEIAAEGHVAIPYVEAGDEVGELARALQGWQEASSVRTILAEQAPAGICRIDVEGRFQEVAGDFYDWSGPEDGTFDLTLADVMGKGVGSALVMATLRTALRATAHEVSPGDRVGRVAESLTGALTDEGLFVTMFHARLDLDSGVLHYVDAGHGYGVVLRPDGEVVRLQSRSLPLGVLTGVEYEEKWFQLEPRDMLLVFTDGLVEVGDTTIEVEELLRGLEGAESAEEVVERLVNRVRGQEGDDVTVLALRRTDAALSYRSSPANLPAPTANS